jgi:hypothetical protein
MLSMLIWRRNFLSPELCDMLSTAAINSNKMQQSKVMLVLALHAPACSL